MSDQPISERFERLLNSKSSNNGEWPVLTDEQVSEFRQFVYDLADHLFAPDYKGRNVLSIYVIDKLKATPHLFIERNIDLYGEEIDEKAAYAAFADLTRTASDMIATGQRMFDRAARPIQLRASKLKADAEKTNDFDGLRALLDQKKLVEFREQADQLIEKYDPPRFAGTGEAAKTPYNRTSAVRRIPEELQILIDDYGLELPSETVRPAIDEITEFLDKAEPHVGTAEFATANAEVREALWRHKYVFGQRALQSVVVRYNRMSEEHRVLKRLAEQGKKVVDL